VYNAVCGRIANNFRAHSTTGMNCRAEGKWRVRGVCSRTDSNFLVYLL
jgi:hypothetical protein